MESTVAALTCLHCKKQITRDKGRGLCGKCFENREVRMRYPKLIRSHSPCRWCAKRQGAGPLRLCEGCRRDPEIRVWANDGKAPTTFGEGLGITTPKEKPTPQCFRPGTEEAIKLMHHRLSQNQFPTVIGDAELWERATEESPPPEPAPPLMGAVEQRILEERLRTLGTARTARLERSIHWHMNLLRAQQRQEQRRRRRR